MSPKTCEWQNREIFIWDKFHFTFLSIWTQMRLNRATSKRKISWWNIICLIFISSQILWILFKEILNTNLQWAVVVFKQRPLSQCWLFNLLSRQENTEKHVCPIRWHALHLVIGGSKRMVWFTYLENNCPSSNGISLFLGRSKGLKMVNMISFGQFVLS